MKQKWILIKKLYQDGVKLWHFLLQVRRSLKEILDGYGKKFVLVSTCVGAEKRITPVFDLVADVVGMIVKFFEKIFIEERIIRAP